MVKNVLLDTDIGGDPDDLLALLLVIAHQDLNLVGVNIYPGRSDQVNLVKQILHFLDIDIPIGIFKDNGKHHVNQFHHTVVDQILNLPKLENHMVNIYNGGKNLQNLTDIYELSYITTGPLGNFYSYSMDNRSPSIEIEQSYTMGGYISDLISLSSRHAEQMVGKITMPEFNFNGHRKGARSLLDSEKISIKYFISKNITHTVKFDNTWMYEIKDAKHPAMQIFYQVMKFYLTKREYKKLHDPLAVMAAINSDLFQFLQVKQYSDAGWGSKLNADSNQYITINVDETAVRRTLSQL